MVVSLSSFRVKINAALIRLLIVGVFSAIRHISLLFARLRSQLPCLNHHFAFSD